MNDNQASRLYRASGGIDPAMISKLEGRQGGEAMNDHFTDEDIKQLVPEAIMGTDKLWYFPGQAYGNSNEMPIFQALLTTRKELKEARDDLADGSAKFMEKILECRNLTARISELEGALKPFADAFEKNGKRTFDGLANNPRMVDINDQNQILPAGTNLGHYRRAFEALR